jgi:hypothetical protein
MRPPFTPLQLGTKLFFQKLFFWIFVQNRQTNGFDGALVIEIIELLFLS